MGYPVCYPLISNSDSRVKHHKKKKLEKIFQEHAKKITGMSILIFFLSWKWEVAGGRIEEGDLKVQTSIKDE